MNVLFISCNYPQTSTLFCQRLAQAGATVLGIGDAPEASLPAHLRDSLKAYRHVRDMNDLGEMKRVARELRDRFGTIYRVDSNIEHWLPTEAEIRRDLQITGMQPEYLSFARSKIGMKKLFADAGVPLMAGITTSDKERLREFALFHGFPLFFKPEVGVGSLGTFRLESIEELDAKMPEIPPGYLCEPYIKGRIVTFDGLADRNSDVFYCTSHCYPGVADMIRENTVARVYSLRDLPPKLEELGRRTVRSFGVQDRFFHIEFFETSPGEYLALEMNLRAPGSTVLHLMNYGSDLDIFKAWARLIVHGETQLDYRRKFHAAHIGRRQHIHYRHDHGAVLSRLGGALVHHARLPKEDHAALGDEAYIIRHESHDELLAMTQFIEAQS
jgi:biotin carboxylase